MFCVSRMTTIFSAASSSTNASVMLPHLQSEQTSRVLTVQSNAVVYIVLVLLLYASALVAIMVRNLKHERDESRISYLYHEFVKLDIFGQHKKLRNEDSYDNDDSHVIVTIAANENRDNGDSKSVTDV